MSQLQVLFASSIEVRKGNVRSSLHLDEELDLHNDLHNDRDYSVLSCLDIMSHNPPYFVLGEKLGLLVSENVGEMQPHEAYLAMRIPLWLKAVFPALSFFFLATSVFGFLVNDLAVGIASLGPMLSALLVTVFILRKRKQLA